MAKVLTKRQIRILDRTWGYILIPITLWAWLILQVGATPIAVMSGFIVIFTLFRATVPCGARTRQKDAETGEFNLCRRNARGLLGGCNQNVAHRWGNAKLLASRTTVGRFFRNLMTSGKGVAAGVSALAGSAAVLVAIGALLVNLMK